MSQDAVRAIKPSQLLIPSKSLMPRPLELASGEKRPENPQHIRCSRRMSPQRPGAVAHLPPPHTGGKQGARELVGDRWPAGCPGEHACVHTCATHYIFAVPLHSVTLQAFPMALEPRRRCAPFSAAPDGFREFRLILLSRSWPLSQHKTSDKMHACTLTLTRDRGA